MIPLRDSNPRRSAPVINTTLIVINILFFFWELSLGPLLPRAMQQWAFVPARFWSGAPFTEDLARIFTSMFLHGGWLHLGGNMLYLWIFGDNIEDHLGHLRYLLFYFACGLAATMAHAISNTTSLLPSVGASGAIAGVLGAYLVLFPHSRVLTVIPIFFYIIVRELPALIVLGFWFVIQIFSGIASLPARTSAETGGVAYFAHIGGFAAGIFLIFLLRGRSRPARRRWPE
ncbi:MAG: rhomboid family intramembrane serine protease [Thermoanaerobaculia bacterium]